jgi:hypothetical protein
MAVCLIFRRNRNKLGLQPKERRSSPVRQFYAARSVGAPCFSPTV